MIKETIELETKECGEVWVYGHVQRIFQLIEIIGEGLEYDREGIWYAVYLHDWGVFPKYIQNGVDHAIRSKQIAEEMLAKTDLSEETIHKVLEAIEKHDYRNNSTVQSTEAVLLRDADFLDFLGVIGIARTFAGGPNDLKVCLRRTINRRELIKNRLILEKSKIIAAERISQMNAFLDILQKESFGYF